jgi:tetratricopeptide (TPR) repeat protein
MPKPLVSLRPSLRRVVLASLGAALAVPSAHAAPGSPDRDDVVLEELPAPAAGAARELREMRAALARDPQNAELAVRLARRYLELGRAESDPRYYGWAEGCLRPWAESEHPPLEVLLLRATLLQSRHAFAEALADLDALLARDPRSAQAWLTRALILQVRGDPSGARRSCMPLLRLASGLMAVSCLANAESLAGRAEAAATALRQALESAPRAATPERVFALTSLAEICVRLDRTEEADRLLSEALALAPRDAYLLAARADLLLDRGRPREVLALLGASTRIDGLLLRVALAEAQLRDPALDAHREELRARFAASRLRGDALHLGEESRFALALGGDPDEALRLAEANFALQREPRDARVLLEAALAARSVPAAEPALALLRETSLEDAHLARLAAQLDALRR